MIDPNTTDDTTQCPNCGHDMYAGIDRCSNCGHWITDDDWRDGPMRRGRWRYIVAAIIIATIIGFILLAMR
jgi:uncharacterized protein (DUF983 family)